MEPLMLQTAQTLQTVAAVQVRQFLHTSHSLQVIIINAECQNAQSLQAEFTFDPTETPSKDVIENFSKNSLQNQRYPQTLQKLHNLHSLQGLRYL